jgi:hypothetical protein
MKHQKTLKKTLSFTLIVKLVRIIETALLVIALLLLSVSCSFGGTTPTESDILKDQTTEIAALKALISSLDAELDALKTRLDSESERIESILTNIESELDSLKEPVSSEPSNEYFGFKYKEENGEISILSYSGSSVDLIIPASIKGKPVTSICDNAFEESDIRSVSIPDTVRSIGWFAFRNCASLTKVIISKNVSEIGYEAFHGCISLIIYTSLDSYVYRYAESYGIDVVAE